MSMVQQLISAVTAAECQIDQQIGELLAYISELDRASDRIQNALSGSTQIYGQEMLQRLAVTRESVNQSVSRLQQAKQKLQTVKMM